MFFRNEMFKTKSKIRYYSFVAKYRRCAIHDANQFSKRYSASIVNAIHMEERRKSDTKTERFAGKQISESTASFDPTRFFPYRRCVYFSNEKLAWAWKCTIPRKPIPVVCLTRCIRASFAIPPLFREQGIFVLVEILDG